MLSNHGDVISRFQTALANMCSAPYRYSTIKLIAVNTSKVFCAAQQQTSRTMLTPQEHKLNINSNHHNNNKNVTTMASTQQQQQRLYVIISKGLLWYRVAAIFQWSDWCERIFPGHPDGLAIVSRRPIVWKCSLQQLYLHELIRL